jgi:enediyne biosynthesis protein E4
VKQQPDPRPARAGHAEMITSLPLVGLLVLLVASAETSAEWQFQDVTDEIGVTFQHHLEISPYDTRDFMTGGLAAADVNGNGLIDLYIPQGNIHAGQLLINQGDGTFVDAAEEWEILVSGGANAASYATGAAFADLSGNGYPDLVLPGVRAFGLRLYLNDGSRFVEATQSWGLLLELQEQWSVSFADVNGSGWLDLAVAHWAEFTEGRGAHLWLNQGDGLIDVGDAWGVSPVFGTRDWTFTPNFADLNGNGWPDLLMAADFETSEYFLNDSGRTYLRATTPVISDENGMGAAVGDINNNGHPDWFVTSIYHEIEEFPIGASGNRLYVNDGNGNFTDMTEEAGVRDGDWGWGSCMADFNNNGHLDIFMVNGWSRVNPDFSPEPARMFVNRGDGTFDEMAVELGVGDTGEGRGIVCIDYDRDGDIDIFIQNNQSDGRVYRNNASTLGNWLGVRLRGPAPNMAAVGAVVRVESGDLVQTRQMAIPNHYLSTSPPELHFGLGERDAIDRVIVTWPDGTQNIFDDIAINQWVELVQPLGDPVFSDRFEESEG